MAQEVLDTDEIVIFADNREFKSTVVKELARLECTVKPKQLEVGDFLLSERVAVERKAGDDFVSSIFDQRLFEQLQALKDSYDRPVLLIEGEDLYGQRDTHPNSIRGALATVAIDYEVPILWTKSEAETAGILFWMAKREQEELGKDLAIRSEKKTMTLTEHQEFLVAGLPDVNNVRAEALLKHFGSPREVFQASEEELQEVEGIGEVLAERIKDVLEREYRP